LDLPEFFFAPEVAPESHSQMGWLPYLLKALGQVKEPAALAVAYHTQPGSGQLLSMPHASAQLLHCSRPKRKP
jgi:hypothetical protein